MALFRHLRVLYSRTLPSKDLKKVADQFTKHNIQGLLIVGGFEVRTAAVVIKGVMSRGFCYFGSILW